MRDLHYVWASSQGPPPGAERSRPTIAAPLIGARPFQDRGPVEYDMPVVISAQVTIHSGVIGKRGQHPGILV